MSQTTTSDQHDRPGQPAPSGRHPVNIGHLVMGMAFVGLVGVWALIQGDVADGDDIRWLLPVPWVLAGIAGLLATTLTGRDRWATRQTGWVAPAETAAPESETQTETESSEREVDPDPTVTADLSDLSDPAEPGTSGPDHPEEIR